MSVELTDAKAAVALKVWWTPWGRAVVEKMAIVRRGDKWATDLLLNGDATEWKMEIIHEACLAVLVKAGGPWPVWSASGDFAMFEAGYGPKGTYPSYDDCLLACVAQALGVPKPKEDEVEATKK